MTVQFYITELDHRRVLRRGVGEERRKEKRREEKRREENGREWSQSAHTQGAAVTWQRLQCTLMCCSNTLPSHTALYLAHTHTHTYLHTHISILFCFAILRLSI